MEILRVAPGLVAAVVRPIFDNLGQYSATDDIAPQLTRRELSSADKKTYIRHPCRWLRSGNGFYDRPLDAARRPWQRRMRCSAPSCTNGCHSFPDAYQAWLLLKADPEGPELLRTPSTTGAGGRRSSVSGLIEEDARSSGSRIARTKTAARRAE